MFISNTCVRTGRILAQIDWKEVALIVFHGLIAFAVGIYVAGETLGNWVHRTNDKLAANWVRLIVVPPTPAEGQALIIEVEQPLPPALETMAILFTTPLMLAAAQAPVALLAAGQEPVQEPPPAATNGRRKRGRRSPNDRARQTA